MTGPSPGCQPPLKLSLITPFHERDMLRRRCMQKLAHTRGKSLTNTHADPQMDALSCTPPTVLAVLREKKKEKKREKEETARRLNSLRQPLHLTKQTPECLPAPALCFLSRALKTSCRFVKASPPLCLTGADRSGVPLCQPLNSQLKPLRWRKRMGRGLK